MEALLIYFFLLFSGNPVDLATQLDQFNLLFEQQLEDLEMSKAELLTVIKKEYYSNKKFSTDKASFDKSSWESKELSDLNI